MDIKELFSDFIQYVDSMDINALRNNIRKTKEHSSEENVSACYIVTEYDFAEFNPHKIKDLSNEVVDCHFDPDYINSAMCSSNDELDWV